MKSLLPLCISSVVSLTALHAVELYSESFETDGNGSRYTLSRTEFATGGGVAADFFTRTDGSLPSTAPNYLSPDGTFFFAVSDTNEVSGSPESQTLTISGIDISGTTNLSFAGLFAEDNFGTTGTEHWDSSDAVFVEVSIDGGAFTKILQFATDGSNESAPLHDTDLDGTGGGAALTSTFTQFAAPITGAGSSLDLRITFQNLVLNDEDIALDNLRVFGDFVPDLTLDLGTDDDIREGGANGEWSMDLRGTPAPGDTVDVVISWTPGDIRVNGDNDGSVTLSYTGQEVLDQNTLDQVITLSAINDAFEEPNPESVVLTFDVQSTNPALNSLANVQHTVEVWDNDGSLGAYLLFDESFETDGNGSRYTLSRTEFATGGGFAADFFTRTDGSLPATAPNYLGPDGTYFFAVSDTNESSGALESQTMTFTGIDIAGTTNLSFAGLFAEDDFGTGGAELWGVNDAVFVEVSIDGGPYQKVLQFVTDGSNNSAPRHDSNLDGTGNGLALTNTFTGFTGAISGTGTSLDLRITFENLVFNDKDIALDNLRILGDFIPALTLLTPFGGIEPFEGGPDSSVTMDLRGTPFPGDSVDVVITWTPGDFSVNGDSDGSVTLSFTGQDVLDGLTVGQVITVVAIDDAFDEPTPENLTLTFDVQSSNPGMNAIPNGIQNVEVWDNDGDTGAGPDGAFLLFSESFETDGNGTRYTTSIPEFNNQNTGAIGIGGDWFTRTSGDTELENASGTGEQHGVTGQDGTYFFSANDTNGPGGPATTVTTDFTGINIAGFTDLRFDGLFAEDDGDDGLQDWDDSSEVTVSAQIDGGGFVDILSFRNNGAFNNTEPGHDIDLDGIRDGMQLTELLTEFGGAIPGTGDSLDLRVTLIDLQFGGEDISFDNLRITGNSLPFVGFLGSQAAGGDPIPDNTFGIIDGVPDFSGSTSNFGNVIQLVGHNSIDAFVLGESVRARLVQGNVIVTNHAATVISTNLDGGSVLISSPDFLPSFGFQAVAFLDVPIGFSTPVTLEVGPSDPPNPNGFSPADNATGVLFNTDLTVNFDENIMSGTGLIEIRESSDDSLIEQFDVATSPRISISNNQLVVDPTNPLPQNTLVHITIAPGAIRDLVGNPYAGFTDTTTWNFQTADPYLLWIDTFFPGETNPAIIGPLANPDGDPFPNWIEYVYEMNPAAGFNETDKVPLVSTEVMTGSQINTLEPGAGLSPTANYFVCTVRHPDDSKGATISVEGGASIADIGDDQGVAFGPIANDGAYHLQRYHFAVNFDTTSDYFVRVAVSQP